MTDELPDLSGLIVLDACSIICLEAADILERVLQILPGDCLVASEVVNEAQWVYSWPGEGGAQERIAIDLAAYVSNGFLRIVTPESDVEATTFIRLASVEMDNGEAMSTAIALHRSATLVTDERKASNYCRREGVNCLSSLDLIRTWSLHDNVPEKDIARALTGVILRARYRPPRSHPLFPWWNQHIDA